MPIHLAVHLATYITTASTMNKILSLNVVISLRIEKENFNPAFGFSQIVMVSGRRHNEDCQ